MNIRDWKRKNQMSRRERMELKAWVCGLGIALLIFLFLGRLFLVFRNSGERHEPEPHVPVVEKLANVWIVEMGEDSLLIYRDGAEERYEYSSNGVSVDSATREQVADVILMDGMVTDVLVKNEKLHGVILGADENFIEVEGYGQLPLASDYKGYRIYNTLAMCSYADLAFGYDFADLVMEDGEICGILMVREETMDSIRVLVRTSDFNSVLHQEVHMTSDTDFVIRYGSYGEEIEEAHAAGEEIVIDKDSSYFVSDRIIVQPSVLSGKIFLNNVTRSQGIPGYRGHMELVREKGGVAVVNDLSLEEYLYSVVPSEMPASYTNEALKAQAVCARTYAYGHMQHAAYPAYGAHVDDSTSYQVYNNILEQESTTRAVKETHGQLLRTADGQPAQTYYYSTSCGVGSDANVWKTEEAKGITYLKSETINETTMQEKLMLREQADANGDALSASTRTDLGESLRDEELFAEFITGVNPDDFESQEGWYRWTYEIKTLSAEHIFEVIKRRYQANENLVLTLKKGEYVSAEPAAFTRIKDMYIAARGSGGVADELILETDGGTYKVISEHNIRYVLCDGETKVKRQSGDETAMSSLLPSGFFIIETGKKNGCVVGYKLTGGGFGHGVGMSQNGARTMAQRGYTYEEILLFFYENCKLENVY